MEYKEIINYPNYEISNDGTIRNKINQKQNRAKQNQH